MNALFATLTVLAYAFIGCFLVGFIDLDFDEDLMIAIATIFLWPAYIVFLIVAIIFRTPVKLGHRCKDKIGAAVNRMLDNLFED